jgi:hypothetical protein
MLELDDKQLLPLSSTNTFGASWKLFAPPVFQSLSTILVNFLTKILCLNVNNYYLCLV